jgi:hypothetical protein
MALSARWRNHIEAWQQSGLSQAAYCRQQGLNANTFSGRLRDYRALPPPKPAELKLLPVRVESSGAPAGVLVLRLPRGQQLELPTTVPPRWLAELLQCLG